MIRGTDRVRINRDAHMQLRAALEAADAAGIRAGSVTYGSTGVLLMGPQAGQRVHLDPDEAEAIVAEWGPAGEYSAPYPLTDVDPPVWIRSLESRSSTGWRLKVLTACPPDVLQDAVAEAVLQS